MKKKLKPVSKEIYPGIIMIKLPLAGGKPGPVNSYLLTGRVPTLIDTGTRKTVGHLEAALSMYGYSFRDIRRVILTHGHVDHYGAARQIRKLSGGSVEIAAHEEDSLLIESGLEVPKKRFINYYRLMGVPVIFRLALLPVNLVLSSMAENCRVDRFLSDGEKIEAGDYVLSVISTPGHTRGSICLYIEKEGVLFSGDQMMSHITPNAFVMLEPDSDLPVRSSQEEFYESLDRIEKLSPRLVLPAHGTQIEDASTIINMFREQFFLRQSRIMEILEYGEFTPYRIGRILFPEIRGARLPLEVYLAVSEVYSHLQVLQKEKRVTGRVKRGSLRFKPA